ncbi:MAG: helix-turn-helix domain-containing protein [Elusimicrobiaceae bacterium]|nr:helix-turn-helix domain-containing protein [Elusimicrobiaceae bacterium]
MDEKQVSEFSKKIKQALELKGMTQKALADKLNIKQGTFAQWLNGRRNPSWKAIKRIATVLDMPLSFFMSEEEKNTNDPLKLTTKDVSYVPLYGTSYASRNSFFLAEQQEAYIIYPKTGEKQFAIRMEGDGMVDKKDPRNSIYNSDYLIIDPEVSASDGEVVLARLRDGYCTVRRLYTAENNKIELAPDNKNYDSSFWDKSEVEILGKVINLYRPVKVKKRRQPF